MVVLGTQIIVFCTDLEKVESDEMRWGKQEEEEGGRWGKRKEGKLDGILELMRGGCDAIGGSSACMLCYVRLIASNLDSSLRWGCDVIVK